MKVNNPFHDCSPCVFLKALCRNNLPERKNPDDLNCQLYGYQKQALRFIVDVETCDIADERVGICTENHYRRGILAVSTGLGKTAIMIAAIIDEQERNKKYY